MNSSRFKRTDVLIASVFLAYLALLAAVPLIMSASEINLIFSEDGPFEMVSPYIWLFTAVLVWLRMRPLSARTVFFFCTFVIFAAREADLHKRFTVDGMLKIGYYKNALVPLDEKIIAGAVAAAIILVVLCTGVSLLRFLFVQHGWRTRAGFFLCVAVLLMVVTKVIDRAPNIFEVEYGVDVAPLLRHIALVLEEGLEMVVPLIFGWSVWVGWGDGRDIKQKNARDELVA